MAAQGSDGAAESTVPVNASHMPPDDAPMLEWALWWAEVGYRVVAIHAAVAADRCSCGKATCAAPGKHPRWHEELLPHGSRNATTDPDIIRKWWALWPDANIAGVAAYGRQFVDVDAHHGGSESMLELESLHGHLPETWEVHTPNGGTHSHFLGGLSIVDSQSTLGPGVDTKGELSGGYVLLPPSIIQGKRYEFELSLNPSTIQAAPMPQWIARALGGAPASKSKSSSTKATPKRDGEPIGRFAENFVRSGCPHRGQRYAALRVARDVWDCGFELTAAQDLVWQGLEKSPNLDPAPWTRKESDALVTSIFRSEPKDRKDRPRGPAENAEPTHIPAHMGPKKGHPASGSEENRSSDISSETAQGEADVEPDKLRYTDLGVSWRMAHSFGEQARYVHEWGWLNWDDRRWARDTKGEIRRLAEKVVSGLYAELTNVSSEERPRKVREIVGYENHRQLRDAIAQAEHRTAFRRGADDFDQDGMLLNCANGTLDLRTGQLRRWDPADNITKLTPTAYDPNAKAPGFKKFLSEVFGGDDELIGYILRCLGYSMTADDRERYFWIAVGRGTNGKTTLFNLFHEVVGGDYAFEASPDSFLSRKPGAATNDLARLHGARFVSISETQEGRKLASGLMKRLSGRDKILARFMFKEFFEFKPVGKYWFVTNNRPKIEDFSPALWRRLKEIPFNVSFEGREDKQIETRLLTEEREGILAMLVRGCLDWQQGGLAEPASVTEATCEYRLSEDQVGRFIAEELLAPEQVDAFDTDTATVKATWARFVIWCKDGNGDEGTETQLSKALKERGYKQDRTYVDGKRARYWIGVELRKEGA